jgi:hypothetical protein
LNNLHARAPRRQDEAKIKELGLAVERMTKDVAAKRDELEAEVG